MPDDRTLSVSRETFREFMKGQIPFEGNQEHLFHLVQGVAHWNTWIEEQKRDDPAFQADLQGVDLRKDKIQQTPLWTLEKKR